MMMLGPGKPRCMSEPPVSSLVSLSPVFRERSAVGRLFQVPEPTQPDALVVGKINALASELVSAPLLFCNCLCFLFLSHFLFQRLVDRLQIRKCSSTSFAQNPRAASFVTKILIRYLNPASASQAFDGQIIDGKT